MSGWPISRSPLLALVPIEPRPTGNGLAMRAAHVLAAAEAQFEPLPVVVPIAGMTEGVGTSPWHTLTVQLDPGTTLRSGLLELFSDPRWRARLEEMQPLPRLARSASPGWATALSRQIVATYGSQARGAPIHVMRSYLAPLGLALAERLGCPWVSLDLDDDDVSFEIARRRPAEGEAFERLLRTVLPLFSRVAMASPTDAARVGARYGLAVATVPNTIGVPSRLAPRQPLPSRLLFVGNLTYEPNVEAARLLTSTLVPRLRHSLGQSVSLALVGSYGPGPPPPDLTSAEGIYLTGPVPDVTPFYATASVVVAPLPPGGGTKIKILEAFAHGVPVVTTPAGAAGLRVAHGRELLIGSNAAELVRATSDVLRDPALRDRLAARALEYVRQHHSQRTARHAVGRFLLEAAAVGFSADPITR